MSRKWFWLLPIMLFALSCNDSDDATPVTKPQNTGTPCPDASEIVYAGRTYHTVKIGDQCWLRENLDVGVAIAPADTAKDNDIIEKYCYHGEPANCIVYGGLYTWDEMMQFNDSSQRGICPEGWHIPDDAEWQQLEANLDSLYSQNDTVWLGSGWRGSDAGGRMKATGLDSWFNPNAGATNTVGFTALPGGMRLAETKQSEQMQQSAWYWTATPVGETDAFFRLLSYTHADIKKGNASRENAFSVRCIKNEIPNNK